MRLNCILGFCLVVALGSAKLRGEEAFRYHCAGGEELAANTNLTDLHKILGLPSTADFEKLALNRLAELVAQTPGFQGRSAKTLLNPLVGDVIASESLGTFADPTTHVGEFIVALRARPNSAQLWQTNLASLWGPRQERFSVEKYEGLHWPAHPSWFSAAGDWLVVAVGNEYLPALTNYLREIERSGRPVPGLGTNWLEAETDLSRLCHSLKPARLKLTIAARNDDLNLTAQAIFPESIPWESKPWQIPKSLIRSPLISFTAGQDVAAFLNLSPDFSKIDHDPLTNQFCAWALGQMEFQSYFGWPVPNASNALLTLSRQAPAALNGDLKKFDGREFFWVSQRGRLVLTAPHGGVTPFIEATPTKEGQFLLMSLFPLNAHTPLAPAELWTQIKDQRDMVYYDWEATGPRLQQWRLLNGMLLQPPQGAGEQLDAMLTREKWLTSVGVPRGNTVTVVTRSAPNELSLIRKAPLGLTGLEWILLSEWLSKTSD